MLSRLKESHVDSIPLTSLPVSVAGEGDVCYPGLKVLCSYYVNAIGKIALLRYLSEFRFQVQTAITSDVS